MNNITVELTESEADILRVRLHVHCNEAEERIMQSKRDLERVASEQLQDAIWEENLAYRKSVLAGWIKVKEIMNKVIDKLV